MKSDRNKSDFFFYNLFIENFVVKIKCITFVENK